MISLENISDEELGQHLEWAGDYRTKFNPATLRFTIMLLDEFFERQKITTFNNRQDVGHR